MFWKLHLHLKLFKTSQIFPNLNNPDKFFEFSNQQCPQKTLRACIASDILKILLQFLKSLFNYQSVHFDGHQGARDYDSSQEVQLVYYTFSHLLLNLVISD